MSTRPQIGIRIGFDGAEQIGSGFRDMEAQGGKAYEAIRAAALQAAAATQDAERATGELATAQRSAADVAKTFIVAGQSPSFADFQRNMAAQVRAEAETRARAQAEINASFSRGLGVTQDPRGAMAAQSAAVFEAEAQKMQLLEAAAGRLRAAIDPLSVAQNTLNQRIVEANLLASKEGGFLLTDAERVRAIELAQRQYKQTAAAIGTLGQTARLSGYQLVNFQYQLNDIVTGLASGQSPFTVLVQQGLQVSQLLQYQEGGIIGGLKTIGNTLLSLLTPARLVGGGIVALLGTVAVAAISVNSTAREVQTTLTGLGRTSGATAGAIEQIAASASSTARISVAAARDMELAFARTGRIGVEQFQNLILFTRRYAETTGENLGDATKTVAEAFANLKTGLDQLDAKLHALDDSTRQRILNLEAQGRYTEAQTAADQALSKGMAEVGENTTALGRIWQSVTPILHHWWEELGEATNQVLDQTSALQKWAREHSFIVGLLQGFRKAQADWNRTTLDAGEVARRVAPEYAQYQKNLNDLALAQKALPAVQRAYDDAVRNGTPDIKERKAALDAETLSIARLTHAKETALAPEEKTRRLAALDAQLAQVTNNADKARLAGQRELLNQAGASITYEEEHQKVLQAEAGASSAAAREASRHSEAIARQTAILTENARASLMTAAAYLQSTAAGEAAEARRKAVTEAVRNGVSIDLRQRQVLAEQIADATAAAAKNVAGMRDETDVRAGLNSRVASGTLLQARFEEQLKLELALRPLLAKMANAEGEAKQKLKDAIDALTKAYGENARAEQVSAAQAQTAEREDQITLLQRQIELTSQSESQRDHIMAQLQAELDIRRRFPDLQEAERAALVANEVAISDLTRRLQLSQATVQQISGAVNGTLDSVGQTLASSQQDWASWANSAAEAIRQVTIQLALINPAKNLIAGGHDFPTLADVFNRDSSAGSVGRALGLAAPKGTSTDPVYVRMTAEGAGAFDRLFAGKNSESGDANSLIDALNRTPGDLEASLKDAGKGAASDMANAFDVHGGNLVDRLGSVLDNFLTSVGGGGGGGGGFLDFLSSLFGSGGGFGDKSTAITAFSDSGASNSLAFVPGFHRGTAAVSRAAGEMRLVDARVFRDAPHFHLGSRDVPSILEEGEGVIPREEMRRMRSGGWGGGQPVTVVNIYSPTGNREIEDMVTRGMRQAGHDNALMFKHYRDHELPRDVIMHVRKALDDPYLGG